MVGDEDELELNNPESIPDLQHSRKRVRVKKRVRIKKKKNPGRKVKKLLKRVMWVLVILALLATFIILVMQLEITDKDSKKRKTERKVQFPNAEYAWHNVQPVRNHIT